jgi:hypothetical protein
MTESNPGAQCLLDISDNIINVKVSWRNLPTPQPESPPIGP